jgi:hypothetical protein
MNLKSRGNNHAECLTVPRAEFRYRRWLQPSRPSNGWSNRMQNGRFEPTEKNSLLESSPA